MLWIPGIDEVPMSISNMGPGDLSGVTVERVGEATTAMHRLKKGDILGLRGPFGNGFTLIKGDALLVAGGTGLAALLPLAEQLKKSENSIMLAYGAKTRSSLFGLERLKSTLGDENIEITTEDGTSGIKGLVTTVAAKMLDKNKFQSVYTCGPELMMRRIFDLAELKGVSTQACLERMVKCSVGLCGSCMIGRYRICRDGPILSSEQLREVKEEFGVFTRGADGSPIRY
jgi:dihydroorotate dehydrogenase electron transfer subunit